MSKISLEPNASGAGTFSIVSPDSNTNRTLNLPDESGTIFSDGTGVPGSSVIGQLASSNMPAGSVIQVKHITDNTVYTTTSTSYQTMSEMSNITFDNNLRDTSSRVVIFYSSTSNRRDNNSSHGGRITVFRNGTNLGVGFEDDGLLVLGGSIGARDVLNFVDTPGRVDPSYTMKFRDISGSAQTIGRQRADRDDFTQPNYLTLMEIAG